MNILRLLTKQLRPLGWSLNLGFKCHRVVPKVKIVSRHVGQAKHFDIWNDKWMHLQYCLPRSYCSQASGNIKLDYEKLDASGNFKLDLEKLDVLNIHEIESNKCKDLILGLLTSYLYPGEKSLRNKDPFIFFTYLNVGSYKNGSISLQQFKEEVSKSVGFQKLLETLPSHLENMGVEDLVDVFGGLLMLGVPIHNSLITELLYKLLNPELELGFAELAKLFVVFELFFTAQHILYHGFLAPVFKCLLMNTSSCDKKNLIFLSPLVKRDWLVTYPEIVDKYLMIISDGLKNIDLHKEIDNIICLYIMHGLGSCQTNMTYQRKMSSPLLLEVYTNLMDMIMPQIEQFTFEQISIACGKFLVDSGLNAVLCKSRPDHYRKLMNHLTKSFKDMISTDSLNIWHLKCLQIFRKSAVGLDEDHRKAVYYLMKDMLIEADKPSLEVISHLLKIEELQKPPGNVIELVPSAGKSLLKLIENNQDDRFQHKYFMIAVSLIRVCRESQFVLRENFGPYITCMLRSGYGCQNMIFSLVCNVAIRIGYIQQRSVITDRIEKTLLSMDGSSKENMRYTRRIVDATFGFGYNTGVLKAVQGALVYTITHKNFDASDLCYLISIVRKKNKYMNFATFAIAKKLESFENIEESLLTILPSPDFLTENMANRLLKYYADHFDSIFLPYKPFTVIATLLSAFYENLSRKPIHLKELEQLCKKILELQLLSDIGVLKSYTFLDTLCHFGIYLDVDIKKVFSNDSLDQLYVAITEQERMKRKTFDSFVSLNRHVVLHRKDLDIPWMPHEPLKRLLGRSNTYGSASIYFLKYVEDILGGYAFFRPDKSAGYNLVVDFKYFVDSEDNLLVYDEAKRLISTNTGIRKCALVGFQWQFSERLCNDVTGISLNYKQKIQDLECLGYEVKFINPNIWVGLSGNEMKKKYLQNLLNVKLNGKKKQGQIETKFLRRILKIFRPNKVTNEELYERTKTVPISEQIRERRWRWINHVLRMGTSDIPKVAIRWTPPGKRSRRRLKENWRISVEKEIKEQRLTWGTVQKMSADRQRLKSLVKALCAPSTKRTKY